MKLNKLFMGIAAMAIVGCSSDDLNVAAPEQAAEDSRLVELNPNFVLAGVGVEDTGTRTHWEQLADKSLVNKFLPTYATAPTAGDYLSWHADVLQQAVGLCWLGNGGVGTDVYTNYEFYHFGWLNNDETKAEVECNELTNGSLYSDITVTAASSPSAGDEADENEFTLPAKSSTVGLNYNSGVYKTENKTIFGGQYIVYYPFNEGFEKAGTIPAKAETKFGDPALGTGVSESFDSPELGKATFRYSSPVTIEGGSQAADFALHNLSSLVQLRVATPEGDALATTATIDQIVLYSAKEQLLKQANLAADKIVAGQKGAGLYASTEGIKTIVANFAAPVTLQETTSTSPKPTSAYITVLPTTVEDLKVLVHSGSQNKWATVDMGKTVFEAGKAKRLDITVASTDFKADYIAVDDASLTTALTEARAVVTATPTAKPVITVIGDITLATTPFNINTAATDPNITIKGDAIIVPQDVTLNLNTNMESDVRVLGKSCCTGTNGGRLRIIGGTVNNVTMEPTEVTKALTPAQYDTYNPRTTFVNAGTAVATIAAGKTFDVQAGNVDVNKAVQHKGNIKIAEGAKLTVDGVTPGNAGDIQFMGSKVTNDGTIEVLKGGKFDITDKDGNASATDGKNMTNNGKFIHNVDAGVGTAVQEMKQNGEYRCKVDEQIKLDDAFLQWTACSVIEMVNAGAYSYNLGTAKGVEYKHNGKYIDIEVNSGGVTTFYNPIANTTTGDGDSEEIKIGDLTVTAGGLNIIYVKKAGKRSLTVNGDMTVKATTTITDSKKITVTENLTVDGATLAYMGKKANVDGLAVTKDIKVSGGTFDASYATANVDALNITCANFYLEKGATATFGNRTDGAAKNLVVSGTISNPAGCTFNIESAGQSGGSVLAWVTCTKLEVGGTFSAARPRVVAAE